MFFALKSYFKFLLKSTNQYGVHSPFVYQLVTQCFYKRNSKTGFKKYVEDIKKSNTTSELSDKRIKLLLKLISYFRIARILEIQNKQHTTTVAFSQGENVKKICTTVEIIEETNISKEEFDGTIKKELVFGALAETIPICVKQEHFDLIYFGKQLDSEKLYAYFETCLLGIHNDAMMIINDIHKNKETENTWRKIKEHSKVSVTIDTYLWGMVFFRKEQEEEHFIIRV